MSAENIQRVRDIYAAFARHDIAAALDGASPDLTFGMVGREEDVPMAGIRHGKAGAEDFFRIMAETVEMTAFEPLSMHAADDKVFVLGRWSWIMRRNGRPGENEWLHVFTFKDGGITSWRGFNDTGQLSAAWRAAPAPALKQAVGA